MVCPSVIVEVEVPTKCIAPERPEVALEIAAATAFEVGTVVLSEPIVSSTIVFPLALTALLPFPKII